MTVMNNTTPCMLDALIQEQELAHEINDYNKKLRELEFQHSDITRKRHDAELKLKSIRSVLGKYVEERLIVLPNHDPFKE